ncbi:MAG: hypothetical protein ACP5DZ_05890 [Bacteroidales bacterium]
MRNHFDYMAGRINEHFNHSDGYVKNLYGQTSDKIKIVKTSKNRYLIRLLEPMTLKFIKVYNDVGSTIFYKYYYTDDKIEEVPLDMSMVKPGICFLKIKTKEGTYLGRLFIS